jgi:hypothetical protein
MTAWIITKDKIADDKDKLENPDGGCNAYAIGLMGPGEPPISKDDMKRLKSGEGRQFRLLDDDDNVYYYGRILEQSSITEEYESGIFGRDSELAPLDNFGSPNAGCTQIEYKNDKGKWEGLL